LIKKGAEMPDRISIWDLVGTSTGRPVRSFTPSFDADLVARAADTGGELSDRLHDRKVQIRKSFIRRDSKADSLPLSAALASSRSEVHLKMAVTLLWASAGSGADPKYVTLSPRDQRILDGRGDDGQPVIEDEDRGRALLLPTDPHVAEFRLPDYAKLLGLPSPKTSGAARVRRSLGELASSKLIWLDRSNGVTPRTQMRREDGSGGPYKLPVKKRAVVTDDGTTELRAEGKFVTLPAAFFTNGWGAALTARAIATLLVVLVQNDLEPDKPVFIAPSIRTDRFGMSEDSFLRGVAELTHHGVLHHESAPVQRDWSTSRGRVRHAFVPVLTALGNRPALEG
jgi:hypothetical protein